jgi:hypothetical protein
MRAYFPSIRRAGLKGLLIALIGMVSFARAQVVFITDDKGNVGRFDTATNTGSILGSLTNSGFAAMQVIGLAYDPVSDSVLIFDRTAHKVYSMNALTGATSLLFTTGSVEFQGGAVLNNLVFGVDENTQKLAAFSFTGVNQNLTGLQFADHTHNLGVNPTTGQLFTFGSSRGAQVVNPDGTFGPVLLSSSQTGSLNPEDVAYFNGNYLAATYSTTVIMVNGTTGAQTTFLNNTQLLSMGVTGQVSGVVARLNTIPEPGTWVLLLSGAAVVVFMIRHRAPA